MHKSADLSSEGKMEVNSRAGFPILHANRESIRRKRATPPTPIASTACIKAIHRRANALRSNYWPYHFDLPI